MRHVNRNKRICKVLIDNEWVKTDMIKLKSGDHFILIESDNTDVEFEGATILYFNSKGKVIDRWGAFCFYDILEEIGLVPPFWELHSHLPNFKK